MGHLQYRRRSERRDFPSGGRADDRVEVAHVAFDVEGVQLPLPIRHLVVARGKTARDQASVIDRLAGQHDIGIEAELLGFAT